MTNAQMIQLVTTCGISDKMLIWRGGMKKPPAKKSENIEPIVRPIADNASTRSTYLSDLASSENASQIERVILNLSSPFCNASFSVGLYSVRCFRFFVF